MVFRIVCTKKMDESFSAVLFLVASKGSIFEGL
jgi:hypothetical protein